MKIVLTGCSGSGKTAIINGLIEKMTQGTLPFTLPHVLYSQTQDVYNRFGVYTEKQALSLPQDQLKEIQFELFNERVQQEEIYTDFISDRSILDYFIWTLIRCNGVLTEADVKFLTNKTNYCMEKYDISFIIESNPKFNTIEDAYKLRSPGQECLYWHAHCNFLQLHPCNSIFVSHCTLKERVQMVRTIILCTLINKEKC